MEEKSENRGINQTFYKLIFLGKLWQILVLGMCETEYGVSSTYGIWPIHHSGKDANTTIHANVTVEAEFSSGLRILQELS